LSAPITRAGALGPQQNDEFCSKLAEVDSSSQIVAMMQAADPGHGHNPATRFGIVKGGQA